MEKEFKDYLERKLDEVVTKTDLEKLAVSTKESFDDMHDSIAELRGEVDQRFGSVHDSIAELRGEMKQELTAINERISQLYSAVDGFVKIYHELKEEFEILKYQFDQLRKRVETLEKKMS